MNGLNEYFEQVKQFNEISPEMAMQKLKGTEKVILYIGRGTCPYCRRFVKKLYNVAKENNFNIVYLDSESKVHEIKAIMEFRLQFNIPTVPGLIVKEGERINVRCDSSMTENQIITFIQGE